MSLSSSNALKLKHVPRTVPDNLVLDAIVAIWRNGIQSSQRKGSDWQIILHGAPWTCKGELGFQARRLVSVLFQIVGDSVSFFVEEMTCISLFLYDPLSSALKGIQLCILCDRRWPQWEPYLDIRRNPVFLSVPLLLSRLLGLTKKALHHRCARNLGPSHRLDCARQFQGIGPGLMVH